MTPVTRDFNSDNSLRFLFKGKKIHNGKKIYKTNEMSLDRCVNLSLEEKGEKDESHDFPFIIRLTY